MKTKLLYIIITFLCSCVMTDAQSVLEKYASRLTVPRVYNCHKAKVAPIIDGCADDVAWHEAEETELFVDISGEGHPAPLYDTRAKMLWDEDNFYVLATIKEPYIRAQLENHDDIVWHENDFEVFIDPNGDGKEYFEIEVNARNTLFELFMTRPYRSGGQFVSTWDCPGLKSAVHCNGSLNDSTDIDEGWTVEMAIPHEALKVGFDNGLKQGRIWRVNFSRVEWLKDGGPEENWVWSPTGAINMHMPERWGYVCLLDEGATTSTITRTKEEILIWALYYAEKDYYTKHKTYTNSPKVLGVAEVDLIGIDRRKLNIECTRNKFEIQYKSDDRTIRVTSED